MKIVGHRGARNEAPENTIPGFAYAVQLGLQAVELDVRRSRDNQLVVIHDATVDRTTDRSGDVGDFTADELANMDARAAHPEWPERCGIPTLTEVLDVVARLSRLLIEIKANQPNGLDGLEPVAVGVLELIRTRGLEGRVTITSFEPAALEIVQRLAPGQSRALIGAGDSPAFLETAQRLGCDQIDVRRATSSKDLIDAARDLGMRSVVWPCNDDDDFARVRTWKPDMITTDRPAWLQALMAGTDG